MRQRDAFLPRAIYADTNLEQRRWRHSQVQADQFWSSFIRNSTGMKQIAKGQPTPQRRNRSALNGPQLPRALWSVGKVSCVVPNHDGGTCTVEIISKGKKVYETSGPANQSFSS